MNTQTQTETNIETTPHDHTEAAASNTGVFAVIRLKEDPGHYITIQAKTRTELSKALSEYETWEIVGVFKGRQLNVKSKVKFSLN